MDTNIVSLEEIKKQQRVKSIEDRLAQSACDLKAFLREHMNAKKSLQFDSKGPGNSM
ncbi:hypothetical protein RYA05_05315 [Pseudomonas syringae pv. actinidiae]|nr:hypothetical protein [Pseudomonas syringae pv. actinidiae]